MAAQGLAQHFHDDAELGFAKGCKQAGTLCVVSALNHVCVTELLKETKGGKKLLEIDFSVKDEIN